MENLMETDSPSPAWKPMTFVGRTDKENFSGGDVDSLQTPRKSNNSNTTNTAKSKISTPSKVLRHQSPHFFSTRGAQRNSRRRQIVDFATARASTQPHLLGRGGQGRMYQTPLKEALRSTISSRRHGFKPLHIQGDDDDDNNNDNVDIDFGMKMDISPRGDCQENCPPFSFEPISIRKECSNPVARTLLSWDDDETPPSPAAIKLRSVPSPLAFLARPKAKRPYSATEC